jgi:regulator of RNase E activity RraA
MLTARIRDLLLDVSTATITTVLLKKGIRRTFMRGPKALATAIGKRVVGEAFTLRFIPAREDVATPDSWSSPISSRTAIEAMPDGCVAVVDALGVTDSGIFGDILALRMRKRGVAGVVTDGVMRDLAGVVGTGLPIWCQGAAAPPSVYGLTFVNWQEPIGCAGVAVFPGDVIVADDDGVVVVPSALAEEVATTGTEQEHMETWIVRRKGRGLARTLSDECANQGPL